MSVPELPPAPSSVIDPQGRPRFGTYAGEMPRVDFSAFREEQSSAVPWPRFLSHKKWIYSLIATPEVLVVTNIADLGYTALGFVVAVDLAERRPLSDDGFLGLPRLLAHVGDSPGRGADASFRTLGAELNVQRGATADRFTLDADVLGLRAQMGSPLRLRAEILAEGAAPPLGVVAPVEGNKLNVTQKHAGLLAFGTLVAGGKSYSLNGGVAGIDYTQGLLARQTAWRWAMAAGRLSDGTPVGFNLVEGFNDAQGTSENALWVGNRLVPLGPARFEYTPSDPLEAWRVVTLDGSVDLSFKPIWVHREERDLKWAKSKFIQPLGHFSGVFQLDGHSVRVEKLPGVTEDQDVLW